LKFHHLEDTEDGSVNLSQQEEPEPQAAAATQATAQTTNTALSFRELHRQRRNRICLHYTSGSYHASPFSWITFTLSSQLRFNSNDNSVPDLLWLACVGVTDAYLHNRLDISGYGALVVDLKRHVSRMFPNDLVNRVGRAVYAEDLDKTATLDHDVGLDGGELTCSNEFGSLLLLFICNSFYHFLNVSICLLTNLPMSFHSHVSFHFISKFVGAMTRIGLSENGRILCQSEYNFLLLRHTSLWDAMFHSNFIASKLQVSSFIIV